MLSTLPRKCDPLREFDLHQRSSALTYLVRLFLRPSLSPELRSQLLCHILAYAEMLLVWELPEKRSELLKLVESDVRRFALDTVELDETLYSPSLGRYLFERVLRRGINHFYSLSPYLPSMWA